MSCYRANAVQNINIFAFIARAITVIARIIITDVMMETLISSDNYI